jgi:alkylation response protein AidB-like acyl-CoA dehydrogenase
LSARPEKDSNVGNQITLFLVNVQGSGINYVPLKTMAGDKQFEVDFQNVKVPPTNIIGEVNQGWRIIEELLKKATVAKCAEMVGGAQWVFETTLNYAKERVQFGRPIGTFQVIQHCCADMVTDLDAARFNTYKAAWMLDQGLECSKEISIAKAWCNEAYCRITALSHQIHGAIGWTKELDLELYTRRARAAEIVFGNSDFHREKIAELL